MFGWLRGDSSKKGGSPGKSKGRPPSPTKPQAAPAEGAKAQPDPSEGGGFFGLSVSVSDGRDHAPEAPGGEEQAAGASGSDSIFSKLSVADAAAEDNGDDGMFRFVCFPRRTAALPGPRPRGGQAAAA